jgi:hypothetical protein
MGSVLSPIAAGGVMFEISNASSILEIAFSINLVGLSLFAAARSTRTGIGAAVIQAIKKTNPTANISRDDEKQVHEIVVRFHPALGKLETLTRWVVAISVVLVAMAAYGLVLCATAPETSLPSAVAWIFAFIALIVVPAISVGLGSFHEWSKKVIVGEIEDHPSLAEATADYYEALLEDRRKLDADGKEADAALAAFNGGRGLGGEHERRRALAARRDQQEALLRSLSARRRRSDDAT